MPWLFQPKLSDFLLDLHRSLAHQGSAKILDISTGMPAVFANPYASKSQHISSQKIAQLRFNSQLDQYNIRGADPQAIHSFELSIYP